jgi:hypothetical protein
MTAEDEYDPLAPFGPNAGQPLTGEQTLADFEFEELFDVHADEMTPKESILHTIWLGALKDEEDLADAADKRADAARVEAEAEDDLFHLVDRRPAMWRRRAQEIEARVAANRAKRAFAIENQRAAIKANDEARSVVLAAIKAQRLPPSFDLPRGQRDGVIAKAVEMGLTQYRARAVLKAAKATDGGR